MPLRSYPSFNFDAFEWDLRIEYEGEGGHWSLCARLNGAGQAPTFSDAPDWMRSLPHRVVLSLKSLHSASLASAIFNWHHIKPPLVLGLQANTSSVRRTSTATMGGSGPWTTTIELAREETGSSLEVRASVFAGTGPGMTLKLWEAGAFRIPLHGSASRFPVESYRFQEDWKWFDLVLPDPSSRDELRQPFLESVRLRIDQTKEGAKQFEALSRHDDPDVRSFAFTELHGLLVARLHDWLLELDPADRTAIESSQFLEHGTSGWLITNLLLNELALTDKPVNSERGADWYQLAVRLHSARDG